MTEPHGSHRCASCGKVVPGLATRICPGCAAAEDKEDEHRVYVEGLKAAFGAGTQAAALQQPPPAPPPPRRPSFFASPIDPVDQWIVEEGDIWEPQPGVRFIRTGENWLESR